MTQPVMTPVRRSPDRRNLMLLTAVKAIRPTAERQIIWDSALTRLALIVSPRGKAVWALQYRTRNGVQRRMTLGNAAKMTPDEARVAYLVAEVTIAAGGDPLSDRRATRAGKSTFICCNKPGLFPVPNFAPAK